MRGRKPTPTALKVLRGNPGKRPLNDQEPVLDQAEAEAPATLVDPVARAEWARVAGLFGRQRVLTEGDRAALTAYVSLFARLVQIQKEMQAPEFRLLITVDGAGNEHVRASENVLVGMERRTVTAMRPYLAELGLTPSSRTRLIGDGPLSEENDPFAKFEKPVAGLR